MDPQAQRKGRWTRRRFAGALVIGLAAAGFVASRAIPHARESAPSPPGPFPTPTPTPSPTPPAVQAALPATPPGTPSPATPAAATPGPPLAPRAAGLLLYTGQLDGKDGIIAVNADGSERRLLTPGFYDGVTWAPDASRFAAVGLQARYSSPNQVAIFQADGTPLARFPLEGTLTGPLDWSPDARHLLCRVLSVAPGAPNAPVAWVLGDDGARQVALPVRRRAPGNERMAVWGWTPHGRLAFISYGTGTPIAPAGPATVWTVTADGREPIEVAYGPFRPLAWSADETILYALGSASTIQDAPYYGAAVPTALLAIYVTGGRSRVLVTADDLASQLLQFATEPVARRWIENGSMAPLNGASVLVYSRLPVIGTPTTYGLPEQTVVLLDWAQKVLTSDHVPERATPLAFAWSPDGGRVAYAVVNSETSHRELHILAPGGAPLLAYPVNNLYYSGVAWPLQWSPDSQWFAYAGPDGLTIASATPPARTAVLAREINSAAWRPR